MSPAFKTGRRSHLLALQLQRARRRRRIVTLLALLVLLPGLFVLLDYHLERSLAPVEEAREKSGEDPDFDPHLVYARARALLEEGRANEHRGRRDLVLGQFEEALDLMLRVEEEAPGYQPRQVSRDIEFLRGRLRQVR